MDNTTTTTTDLGQYTFANIPLGDCKIVEVGVPYLQLVSVVTGCDTLPEGNVPDIETKVDNIIGVTVELNEVDDDGNDFVDSYNGLIGGSVTDEVDEPLKNAVTFTLTKPDGRTITTATDSKNEKYPFTGSPLVGTYTLTKINPPGYGDLSDNNEIPDGNVMA